VVRRGIGPESQRMDLCRFCDTALAFHCSSPWSILFEGNGLLRAAQLAEFDRQPPKGARPAKEAIR
jgi:hypothetical protein